jgi:predicted small lipoprotein YifL
MKTMKLILAVFLGSMLLAIVTALTGCGDDGHRDHPRYDDRRVVRHHDRY